MGVFDIALKEMEDNNKEQFGPIPFAQYTNSNDIHTPAATSSYLSPQSFRELKPELRNAQVMVFRLGNYPGQTGTSFALIKWNQISDFFFIDDDLFLPLKPELYVPTVPLSRLFAFHLLPGFTETSFVNFAVSSGLLSHALNLDADHPPFAPATGSSTYSFKFKPYLHSQTVFEHLNGQVEIDAVFTAKRDGLESLFVVEAKFGKKINTLPKHKLAYSVLAMENAIPAHMPIIPVYLRGIRENDTIHIYIAECHYQKDDNDILCLDTFIPNKRSYFVLLGV